MGLSFLFLKKQFESKQGSRILEFSLRGSFRTHIISLGCKIECFHFICLKCLLMWKTFQHSSASVLYESSSSISYREIKIILNVIVQKEVMLKNVHFREKILWHKQGFPVHNRFANWLFIQLTKGFHFKSSTMMTFFSRCYKFGNGIFPSRFQCFLKYSFQNQIFQA